MAKALADFPYLDHYLELAKIERELVGINNQSRVIFVGGGPMPLSPICLCLIDLAIKENLLDELSACLSKEKGESRKAELCRLLARLNPDKLTDGLHIISVEKDEAAAQQSASLVKSLRLDQAISVQQVEGKNIAVSANFNTFFIAAMVSGKQEVIGNIIRQVPSGGEITFLIRSVEKANLRALLYEPTDNLLFDLEKKYPSLHKYNSYVPPPGSILINSAHVYKYKNIN